jgi:hypothetical protein
MRKITKRSAAIIAASVIAIGGAGAAWAAWTFSGTGNASVSAATATPLTVTGETVAGPMVPGTAVNVSFTVKNPNSFPVLINSITYGTFTSTTPGCAGQLEQVVGAALPVSRDLAAGAEKNYTYAGSLKLVDNPDTNCQGAAYGFKVVLGATSDTAP